MNDQKIATVFFNGLERANPAGKWAYFLVHHTPKPAKIDKGGAMDPGAIYMGHGSAVFANRPRASMNLEPRKGEPGRFYLHLGKGGVNAGVTRDVPHGMGTRMEATRRIALKYSDGRLKLEWGELPLVLWEPDEDDGPEADMGEHNVDRGGRKPKYTDDEILESFPTTIETALSPAQIIKKMGEDDIFLHKGSLFHFNKRQLALGAIVRVRHPKGDRFYRK